MWLAFELNGASKGAKRRLRPSVLERAVSRALSYQRAACMAMPTKTSATITIKAATMMSIVIAPSTTECGDQCADGGRGCQEERIHETHAGQPDASPDLEQPPLRAMHPLEAGFSDEHELADLHSGFLVGRNHVRLHDA